jgi:hypothetical protein
MLENPEYEVDVVVVDRELSPVEICELQLISAMHSTSLSAFDQALACKAWMDQNPGATAKELAAKIDRDPSMLTRLNSLLKTIPAVVKAAEEGKIGPKAWYQISLLPESEQATLLDLYLGGAPASQIAEFCRKKRTSGVPGVKVSRIKAELPSGVCIVASGKELSLDDFIESLGEAQREAKKAREEGLDVRTFQAVLRDRAKKG